VLPVRRPAFAAAEGASQAEVLVDADDSALTRFANSEIHQNVATLDRRLSLRFVDGRRVGCAATNRLDEASLRRLGASAGRPGRPPPSAGGDGWRRRAR